MMNSEQILHSQLVQSLQSIRDYRSSRGKRYPLWVMLIIAVLGVMSGCKGYQALEDFGIRHYQNICEILDLSLSRMPSDSTLRRMFLGVSFLELTAQFNSWAQTQSAPENGDWFSVDAKSLRGTVEGGMEAFQDFVSVVSVYSHEHRLVLAQKGYQNKLESEIHVVQKLLEELNLSGVVFTMDALHCQKETVQQLVKQNNDYLIAVKGNQPKLMEKFQTALSDKNPESWSTELDTSHGRRVNRTVEVFEAPDSLAQDWPKASSLVVVHRKGVREGKEFETTSFHLSSLKVTSMEVGLRVRGHRDIENGLHWVRDVIFQEDLAPFKQITPAINWSGLRSMALNIFRDNGYPSITRAFRLIGNDIRSLFSLLTTN